MVTVGTYTPEPGCVYTNSFAGGPEISNSRVINAGRPSDVKISANKVPALLIASPGKSALPSTVSRESVPERIAGSS